MLEHISWSSAGGGQGEERADRGGASYIVAPPICICGGRIVFVESGAEVLKSGYLLWVC